MGHSAHPMMTTRRLNYLAAGAAALSSFFSTAAAAAAAAFFAFLAFLTFFTAGFAGAAAAGAAAAGAAASSAITTDVIPKNNTAINAAKKRFMRSLLKIKKAGIPLFFEEQQNGPEPKPQAVESVYSMEAPGFVQLFSGEK